MFSRRLCHNLVDHLLRKVTITGVRSRRRASVLVCRVLSHEVVQWDHCD